MPLFTSFSVISCIVVIMSGVQLENLQRSYSTDFSSSWHYYSSYSDHYGCLGERHEQPLPETRQKTIYEDAYLTDPWCT